MEARFLRVLRGSGLTISIRARFIRFIYRLRTICEAMSGANYTRLYEGNRERDARLLNRGRDIILSFLRLINALLRVFYRRFLYELEDGRDLSNEGGMITSVAKLCVRGVILMARTSGIFFRCGFRVLLLLWLFRRINCRKGGHRIAYSLSDLDRAALVLRKDANSTAKRGLALLVRRFLRRFKVLVISRLSATLLRATVFFLLGICNQQDRMSSF